MAFKGKAKKGPVRCASALVHKDACMCRSAPYAVTGKHTRLHNMMTEMESKLK
jgi:hypothetical protein